MTQAVRDPRQWAVFAEPAHVLFAERPSEAQARVVVEEYEPLIRKFGAPTIEPPIVDDLESKRRIRAAFRELEHRGFALVDG